MTYAPLNTQAGFLNTAEVFPEDKSQFLIKLTSTYTDIANRVNIREIGTYQDQQQILTGQQFSTPGDNQTKKFSFRQMYYFGAIAPGATLTIPHNILGLVQFTHLYGTCITAVPDFRPVPFVDTSDLTGQISLRADATNIYVINGAIAPAITSGLIVAEYLLN